MPKKKILLVGGAGFVGSHINLNLHLAGYNTVVFDNLSAGDVRAVTRGTFTKGDLDSSKELDTLFSAHHFDAVIHLAASIDVGESAQCPSLYYRNNVVNSLNLLEAMLRHQVDTLIFSSTAAVYGSPQALPLSETHPCHPTTPYGQTKAMVEQILSDFAAAYNLRFCSLRYFNAAGADPTHEVKNYKKKEHNLIPKALLLLKSQKNPPFTIYGTDYPTSDGTCVRDYIHVLDLADAHVAAMERLLDGADSCCYNLGNGKGFSVRQVLSAISSVTGLPFTLIEGKRRSGDPPILLADASKAQKELGWHPRYPELETMISHAWQALQESSCVR